MLISNYGEYHRLAAYLFRHTKKLIGIVMGVPTLRELFDERYYADLDGGILESFGRLFKNDLKIYAYPLLDAKTGALITAGNLRVAPHLRHLCAYLVENRLIESIRDFDAAVPADLLARRARAHSQRRPALGRDDAARRGRAHQESRTPGLPGDESGRRGGLASTGSRF